jgi:NAD+ kinase
LYHPSLTDAPPLAQEITDALEERGVQVWTGTSGKEAALIEEVPDLDMFIILGGDGTILHAARMAAPHDIPILGVNLGRLGFLAEMEPSEIMAHVPRLCEGDYWLEARTMLHAAHRRDGALINAYDALNDVILARGRVARVVRVSVSVDQATITTYVADGIIAATATGSTGYNLSAGGPIVPPGSDNIVLTPIAPHLTPARSLVLPSACEIVMGLETHHEGVLTVDGEIDVTLANHDRVIVSRSDERAHFVRLGSHNYYYKTLIQRLNRRTDESGTTRSATDASVKG